MECHCNVASSGTNPHCLAVSYATEPESAGVHFHLPAFLLMTATMVTLKVWRLSVIEPTRTVDGLLREEQRREQQKESTSGTGGRNGVE